MIPDEPTKIERLNAFRKEISTGTRIADRVTTHAVWRGARRDVVHLPHSSLDISDRTIGSKQLGDEVVSVRSRAVQATSSELLSVRDIPTRPGDTQDIMSEHPRVEVDIVRTRAALERLNLRLGSKLSL